MNRLMMSALFLLMSGTALFAQTGGGSDASGGGDGLETQILEGKFLAIDALSQPNETAFKDLSMDDVSIQYFMSIREALIADLKQSEFRIYKNVPSQEGFLMDENRNFIRREEFVIDGYEKTFITTHRPHALIKVNFPRCEKLSIRTHSAAVLFVRESARHLGIQDDLALRNDIEKIALVLVKSKLSGGESYSDSLQSPVASETPQTVSLTSPLPFPMPMERIPSSPYQSNTDLLRNEARDHVAFEISPQITYDEFTPFLNQYVKKNPTRIDPKTKDVTASDGNKLFLKSYEISYESSIDNAWRNGHTFWRYFPLINLPGTMIEDWIQRDYFFVRNDCDKSKAMPATWAGAREFCTFYGLDLPSGVQLDKAKHIHSNLSNNTDSDKEWISPPDMNPGLKLLSLSKYGNAYANVYSAEDTAPFRCVRNDMLYIPSSDSPQPEINLAQITLNKINSEKLEGRVGTKKKYYSEDFFHYYIQKDSFTETEQNIIHGAYTKVAKLLADHGFPITFQYRGLLETQIQRKLDNFYPPWDRHPMEIESDDKRNTIYRGVPYSSSDNWASNTMRDYLFADIGRNYATIELGGDIILNKTIRDYPYIDDKKKYHPCLCEVIDIHILERLGYSNTYHLTEGPGSYTEFSRAALSKDHVHFSNLDYFFTNTKRKKDLEEVLKKIQIVERPHLALVEENDVMAVYQAINGIFIKFNDEFRKAHYKGSRLQLQIEGPNDDIVSPAFVGPRFDDSEYEAINSVMDTFFAISDMRWDPTIESLAIGEFRHQRIDNLPVPGTPVVLKVLTKGYPDAMITSISFNWPDLRPQILEGGRD